MNKVAPPIGCVKTIDAKEAGFINYSELISPVKNVEECIKKAKIYGNLCRNKKGEEKCKYVVYNDKDHYDYARTAHNEYLKYKQSLREEEKQKYLNNSIQLFKNLWLSFNPVERKEMYHGNKPFLLNYCPKEITNNPEFSKYLEDNLNTEMFSLPLENMCWIGSSDVLENRNTFLGDPTKNNDKLSDCGYNMYIIPGTEGENILEKTTKYFKQKAIDAEKMIKKYTAEQQKAQALSEYVEESKNSNIFSLINGMNKKKNEIEIHLATKDNMKELKEKLQKNYFLKKEKELFSKNQVLKQKIKKIKKQQSKLFNDIYEQEENRKRKLNWTLNYSWDREKILDNIILILGYIITLLCIILIGFILFNFIGTNYNKSSNSYKPKEYKPKEYKKALDSLFYKKK